MFFGMWHFRHISLQPARGLGQSTKNQDGVLTEHHTTFT